MKLSKKSFRVGAVSLAVFAGGLAGWHARTVLASGIPTTNPFTYSGIVTDDAGGPLRNTQVSVAIFDAASAGTQQCSGATSAQTGADGRFSIPLAAGCTTALQASTSLFVEVSVAGVPVGARTQIGAVPYAASSSVATSVSGMIPASQITSNGGTVEQRLGAVAAPGTIVATAATSCPTGTVAADGTSIARVGTYASLFAALGTTYGAADGNSFSLPDARGVFIRGAGTQTIGGLSYTGTQGVSRTDTTKKNGLTASSSPHQHVSNNGGAGNTGPYGMAGFSGSLGNFTASPINLGSITSPATVSVSLGDGDAETSPAHIAVLYCIAY